jgi:sterol 3beta-glucosyltransferase
MPKRLSIFTLGSRGDVQPYAALGVGLQAAGYRVRIVTFESFRGLVEQQGLDFLPVLGDAHGMVEQMMRGDGITTRNPLILMRKIMQSFGAMTEAYVETFSHKALEDSDAILNQLPGGILGADVAEKLGVPHIMLSVIPLKRTRSFANPLLTTRDFGAPVNALSYTAAAQLLWANFRPIAAKLRSRLGLRKPAYWLSETNTPLINGFSPRVVPPPRDWGTHTHTVGYWHLPDGAWQPAPALLEFLANGAPPVFIGFGSMIPPSIQTLTQTVVDTIQRVGCRAIIGAGWGNLGEAPLPPTIFRLDYAPYQWLFPRMGAIVHHGGSGTTSMALHSGVPSMVVAFGADQPYWGKRTAALGAGLPPLSIKTLQVDSLAASLERLLHDEGMGSNAAALGAELRQECGIENAINILERYL